MTFPLCNFVVWHVAVPYLDQAVRPLDRNFVAIRRWDQAERGLLRQRTMPLSVKVHFSAELAVAPGVLTRHVVDGVGRAGLYGLLVLPELHQRHQTVSLPRIRGSRQEKRLATRGGHGVTQGREDQEEEENDYAEEGRRDQVQEAPLPRGPLRCGQVQVTHFRVRSERVGRIRSNWHSGQQIVRCWVSGL